MLIYHIAGMIIPAGQAVGPTKGSSQLNLVIGPVLGIGVLLKVFKV